MHFFLYTLLIIIVVTGWPLRCLLLNTNRAALAGEMSGSLGSPGPGLELDTVTVEAVPQKKGIILRHVEYTVKYSTQYSAVQHSTVHYSAVHRQVGPLPLRGDQEILQALADLLLYRCWVLWPSLGTMKTLRNYFDTSTSNGNVTSGSRTAWCRGCPRPS